jgi:aldehyde:ferredoxin oxidoreductase
MEIPGYDVRGPVGMALAYATADRGGDHLRAWTIVAEANEPFTIVGKAKLNKDLQDRNSALWCLIGCDNIPANTTGDPAKFVDLSIAGLNSLDWEMDKETFLETGERIYNVTRLFNVREGFSRKDDQLPARFEEPREDTGWKIAHTDFNKMLDEYYAIRGWDGEGKPKAETLKRLGIDKW